MKNKIKNMLLGLLIITTAIASAQTDNVKRFNRYEESPEVTTIYPITSLVYVPQKHELLSYDVSILCDSINPSLRLYRIYAEIHDPIGYPQFELCFTDGTKLTVYPEYIAPHTEHASYIEAMLDEHVLKAMREGKVKSVGLWHWDNWKDGPYPITCGNYFKDFLAKY